METGWPALVDSVTHQVEITGSVVVLAMGKHGDVQITEVLSQGNKSSKVRVQYVVW